MKRVYLFFNTTKFFIYIVYFLINFSYLTFAIPQRGNEPWSMILCKFADLPNYEPKPKEWFQQWLVGIDNDSIESFFAQMSNNVYTIKGSTVHGWFKIPYTQSDVLRLAKSNPTDPLGSNGSFDYFDKIKELCVNHAIQIGENLHHQKITVINAGTTAVYGKKNGVLLTPQLIFSSVLTHEMIHSFFIGHSYSDRKIRVFPYALNGEYDDKYDLMSTANAYMHSSKFGMNGPGLNGAHLDFLGWLPMDRMLYFGRDGRQNYTLRISSLSVPHNLTKGWLLVMIPYNRDDPNSFFTVELRSSQSFDKGISQTSVLIHKVQKVGKSYYSVLLSQANDFYELTEKTEWVKYLEPNTTGQYQMIKIFVRKLYENDADLTISSTFNPKSCHLGEIDQTISFPTNSESSNVVLNVCLDKNRILDKNNIMRHLTRQNFFSLSTFGSNACQNGYVWRGLDAYDYVCVTEDRRNFATEQFFKQDERISVKGYGCTEPYLPRKAFLSDEICVTPIEKFRTYRENLQSAHILQHFTFFNGVDTVSV